MKKFKSYKEFKINESCSSYENEFLKYINTEIFSKLIKFIIKLKETDFKDKINDASNLNEEIPIGEIYTNKTYHDSIVFLLDINKKNEFLKISSKKQINKSNIEKIEEIETDVTVSQAWLKKNDIDFCELIPVFDAFYRFNDESMMGLYDHEFGKIFKDIDKCDYDDDEKAQKILYSNNEIKKNFNLCVSYDTNVRYEKNPMMKNMMKKKFNDIIRLMKTPKFQIMEIIAINTFKNIHIFPEIEKMLNSKNWHFDTMFPELKKFMSSEYFMENFVKSQKEQKMFFEYLNKFITNLKHSLNSNIDNFLAKFIDLRFKIYSSSNY